MVTNKKIGNDFETEFCNLLSKKGFWVHNFAQNQAGQPADIIAVKNQKAYLIDCKVCENDRFPFSRSEENQCMSMDLWHLCGNHYGLFALRLKDGEIYIIDYELIVHLWMANESSLNRKSIEQYGIPFNRWVSQCM